MSPQTCAATPHAWHGQLLNMHMGILCILQMCQGFALFSVFDYFRNEAAKLLMISENGTFLCRPTSQPTELAEGGMHTHTIDVV